MPWPAGSPHMTNHKKSMQATWNGVVIAESDDTVVVEGNHYFPRDSIHEQFLVPTHNRTSCPWKGNASYFTLSVEGKENRDAAWYYPSPMPAARRVTGRVAFFKGVKVRPVAVAEGPSSGGTFSRLRDRFLG